MSATISGAIKAKLEGLQPSLGLPVFRDGAPTGRDGSEHPLGYITVQEGVATVPERHGDHGDPQAHLGVEELVQVDLWQPARVRDPQAPGRAASAESYTLPGRIFRALHGGTLPAAPVRVYGTRVSASQRYPVSENVVRHRFDVTVRRDAGGL